MSKFKCSTFLVCGLGMMLTSAACTLDAPTYYRQGQMEVREKHFDQAYEVASLDKHTIEALAQEYYKAGSGDLNVTVTYDPRSKRDTARFATQVAADIAETLRQNGVRSVKTDILPIVNSKTSKAHISFNYLEAHAPEGCYRLDQVDDSAVENYRDYELGCSTDIFMAQQVARPEDLLGRAVSQDSLGHRESVVVRGHKSGAQRDTLDGESTSGD